MRLSYDVEVDKETIMVDAAMQSQYRAEVRWSWRDANGNYQSERVYIYSDDLKVVGNRVGAALAVLMVAHAQESTTA